MDVKSRQKKVDVKYASATFCLRCPHARRPSRQCSSTVFLASDFVVHRFFQETKSFHTSIEHPVGTTLQNYSNFKRMNQGTTNSQVLHRDLADGTQDNSWQLTLRDRSRMRFKTSVQTGEVLKWKKQASARFWSLNVRGRTKLFYPIRYERSKAKRIH